MGFKDLFEQKLQVEQDAASAARVNALKLNEAHAELVAELKPKLQALILEVFATLEAAGLPPVDVAGMPGVKAYALGRLDSHRRWGGHLKADVAIDSNGEIALLHEVQTRDLRPSGPVTVLGCGPISSEALLGKATRGDEPTGDTRIHLNSRGEIMFTEQYIASDDYQHRRSPLAEYLADLAVKAAART